MTRPSVIIAAGAIGLLAAGLAVKQCRTSESGDLAVSRARLASVPRQAPPERNGWIARSDDAAPPSAEGGPHDFAPGGRAAGTAGERGDASLGGGTGSVVRGVGRGAGMVARGGGSTRGGSGSIQVDSALPEASLPFDQDERWKSLSRRPGDTTEVRETSGKTGPAGNEQSSSDKPDENGPALSLPFEDSTLPDKGDTAPVVEQGVEVNPGEGARFAADSQFVIPDASNLTSGEAGTISFWVQPEWSGNDDQNASLVQMRADNVWENRLSIFRNGRYLRFLLTPNTGVETDVSTSIDNWQPGERYLVTTTWGQNADGVQQAQLYINGQLVSQRSYDGQLQVAPGVGLNVGSDHPGGGPGAQATINNFLLYNRALPPDEIASLASRH